MSSTLTPQEAAALETVPCAELIVNFFRMTVDQYERLADTGVLDGQAIELINGLLVRNLLIEVADTTLDRDRGEKQLANARGGAPVYWIVNLVDRQLEIYTEPGPAGYRQRRVLGANDQAWVTIGGQEIGPIAVSAILPQSTPGAGTHPTTT